MQRVSQINSSENSAYRLHFSVPRFYWDNFIYFGSGPQKGPDEKYYLTFPIDDKKMAGIASEDIGKCAYGVFKDPSLIGKTVGVAGEHLTGEEMAAALTKSLILR